MMHGGDSYDIALGSLRVMDDPALAHVPRERGTVFRGAVAGALYKSQPSIPSDVPPVPQPPVEQKGFSSTVARFQERKGSAPGPGAYVAASTTPSLTVSFSTRGTGSFASKSRRFQRDPKQADLGPGSYELRRPAVKAEFHRINYSSYPERIAPSRSSPHAGPAPNAYTLPARKAPAISSAFLSTTDRSLPATTSLTTPSPAQYRVRDDLRHRRTPTAASTFASSSTSRSLQAKSEEVPGPGAYSPTTEAVLPRHAYTAQAHRTSARGISTGLTLARPAVVTPEPEISPGPGSYDPSQRKPTLSPPQDYVAFGGTLARSSREDVKLDPGPCSYNPASPSKQSFHFNTVKRWM